MAALLKAEQHAVVSEVNDRAGFQALESGWDALVERAGNSLFSRHLFQRIWLDNFAPRDRLRILTVQQGDVLLGILPLIERRTSLYRIPVTELSSVANAHSCRSDLIAAPADALVVADAVVGHLRADPSWDVVRLVDVPELGAARAILRAACAQQLPTGTWPSTNSPYMELPSTYETCAGGLQAKFKANLRRRRRKLAEKGAVTVERVRGGDLLDAKLEEGFALEQSGWKGERGTAMAQDKPTRGFYTELAREAAARGLLELFYLRLDGRAVAFQYALRHDGRYLLLKPGYDEGLRECSPGQLLMEDVLTRLCAEEVREFDFLGPDMIWKRDWTDRARQHHWIYLFRDNILGRGLCAAKFNWVPAAKEAVARWKK